VTLPEEIIRKLERLVYQKDALAKDKQEMIQRQIEEVALTLEQVSLAELHVLDRIGIQPALNVIGISKYMNMTRGAISKICTRLERKGLIVKKQLPSNQKEVFFQVTLLGQKLWDIHQQGQKRVIQKYMQLLSNYNKDELLVIDRFLYDLVDSKKR
jgi:DNA-binding MarR family transcriptional regulator